MKLVSNQYADLHHLLADMVAETGKNVRNGVVSIKLDPRSGIVRLPALITIAIGQDTVDMVEPLVVPTLSFEDTTSADNEEGVAITVALTHTRK